MLSTNRSSSRPALISALAFLLALGVTQLTLAQAPSAQPTSATSAAPKATPPHKQTPAAPAEAQATAPNDAAHQGIKVHGHWTIDVKNPDGTLVEHRDFENSIQYDGQNYLVGLLSGYAVNGGYGIYFSNATASTTNAVCTSGQYPYCAIVQSTTAGPGIFACISYTCVGGLTVTPTFGLGPTIKLAGTITAPNAGSIAQVFTSPAGCNAAGSTTYFPTTVATITPAACMASNNSTSLGGTMTLATLSSPISVVAGQIIQISVTLSFS